jgi:hypothetical protein
MPSNYFSLSTMVHKTYEHRSTNSFHDYTGTVFFSLHDAVSKIKVMLSFCLSNSALLREGVLGSGCIDPHFLDVGTSWRRLVSFTPRQFYLPGKELPVPSG